MEDVMAKKNAVPTLAPQASAQTPEVKKDAKPPKMARKQAEALVAAGIITAEQLAEMEKKDLVTSGEGGGLSIDDQMLKAGADPADVKLLDEVCKRISTAIKGKRDEKNREIVGVAAWVKHKAEKETAESKS
jgi:hypothetical protein